MRKILNWVAYCCFAGVCQAQKLRFTDTGNLWAIMYTESNQGHTDFYPGHYYFDGDTLLGGRQYKILHGRWMYGGFQGFVREDSTLRRVYIRQPSGLQYTYDTTEQVLYDYNLKADDSLVSYSKLGAIINKYTAYVTAVDSVQIGAFGYNI